MSDGRSRLTPGQRWALWLGSPAAAALGESLDALTTDPKLALERLRADLPEVDRYTVRQQLEDALFRSQRAADLSLRIQDARWAATLGWLTHPQAWSVIMEVARTAQRTFRGWDDFAQQAATGLRTRVSGEPQRKRVLAAIDVLRAKRQLPEWNLVLPVVPEPSTREPASLLGAERWWVVHVDDADATAPRIVFDEWGRELALAFSLSPPRGVHRKLWLRIALVIAGVVGLLVAITDSLIGTRYEAVLYWLVAAGFLSIPIGYLLWRPTRAVRLHSSGEEGAPWLTVQEQRSVWTGVQRLRVIDADGTVIGSVERNLVLDHVIQHWWLNDAAGRKRAVLLERTFIRPVLRLAFPYVAGIFGRGDLMLRRTACGAGFGRLVRAGGARGQLQFASPEGPGFDPRLVLAAYAMIET